MSIFKCKIFEKNNPSNYIIYRIDSIIYMKIDKLTTYNNCKFKIQALSIINSEQPIKVNYNALTEWLFANHFIKSKIKFLNVVRF